MSKYCVVQFKFKLGCRDRQVARVAMVNEQCEKVFDAFVKPAGTITSCLTALTGITMRCVLDVFAVVYRSNSDLKNASDFNTVRNDLCRLLPKDAVLVGQAIQKGTIRM